MQVSPGFHGIYDRPDKPVSLSLYIYKLSLNIYHFSFPICKFSLVVAGW